LRNFTKILLSNLFQDEINAALANFRSVKALNGSALLVDNKMEHKGPPPTPPRPTLKVMSIVAKRKEQFESQKKRSTLPHSQTLQEHMERESPEPSERTTCNEGKRDEETSLDKLNLVKLPYDV
jgi:hypothetical protein